MLMLGYASRSRGELIGFIILRFRDGIRSLRLSASAEDLTLSNRKWTTYSLYTGSIDFLVCPI